MFGKPFSLNLFQKLLEDLRACFIKINQYTFPFCLTAL